MALAPIHLVKKARESGARCMEHELAEYQKQDDVSRANRVNTTVEMWPLTQDRVVDWILQYKPIGCTAFGPRFILRSLLDKLLLAMQEELQWLAIRRIGCMTLAWAIHKGIRAVLGLKRNFKFLKQVLADFEICRTWKRTSKRASQWPLAAMWKLGQGLSETIQMVSSGCKVGSPVPTHLASKQGRFEYGTNIAARHSPKRGNRM